MAGQVEAGDLFFHFEQIAGGIFRRVGDLVIAGSLLLFPAHHAEKVHLAFQVLTGVGLDAFQDTLGAVDHSAAAGLRRIEGACLDEVFQRAAIQFVAVQPLAEIVQAAVGAVFTLLYHRIDQVAAHAFDGVETEADAVAIDGEAAAGGVDVRRQDLDAQALALGSIFDNFRRIIEHTGQQGGHELVGVMALEVGCLEGHVGVAGRVGLVEGVGGKTDHIIVDLVCHCLRDAVFDAASALLARLGASMDKMFALGLHDLELFLAHSAAHIVGLAEAEACQLTADLHDLLLINDDTVGHIHDVGHLRGLVNDLGRVLSVAQIRWDGVHRAGAVQRDQGDDIFQVFRAHAHQHLGHAGRFKLEDAHRLAAGQHLVGGGVVVVNVGHPEIRVLGVANGHLGIVDDGEGAQAQEVHLQQAQALDLHHVELGDRQAVVGGQGHVLGGRFTGNDDACGVGGGMAGHALNF